MLSDSHIVEISCATAQHFCNFSHITKVVSSILIPEADPEKVLKAEETRENDLKALASQALEEAEIKTEYDIGYEKDFQKSKNQSGTFYQPTETSPYYDGPKPEIHTPIETSIEEFYASLNGDFRLVDKNREAMNYKLIISCDEGMLLKGEIGYGEKEITDFRYRKDGENPNTLQIHLDGRWVNYGEAEEIGQGNETMKRIEFMDSVLRQLNQAQNSKSEEDGVRLQNYTQADARTDLRLLDRAFNNLKDSTVNSLTEFETKSVARIDKHEHPFSKEDWNGAKGGHAAQRIAYKFSKLRKTNIVDYNVSVAGGHPSADIEIDGSLDELDRTISDFVDNNEDLTQDTLEEIVEQRFTG